MECKHDGTHGNDCGQPSLLSVLWLKNFIETMLTLAGMSSYLVWVLPIGWKRFLVGATSTCCTSGCMTAPVRPIFKAPDWGSGKYTSSYQTTLSISPRLRVACHLKNICKVKSSIHLSDLQFFRHNFLRRFSQTETTIWWPFAWWRPGTSRNDSPTSMSGWNIPNVAVQLIEQHVWKCLKPLWRGKISSYCTWIIYSRGN